MVSFKPEDRDVLLDSGWPNSVHRIDLTLSAR